MSHCKVKISDYKAAISLATDVIVQDPSCSLAYQARAKVHQAAGDLDKACQDLTEAVKLAPPDRELCGELVRIKEEQRAEQETAPEEQNSDVNDKKDVEELNKFCGSFDMSLGQGERRR